MGTARFVSHILYALYIYSCKIFSYIFIILSWWHLRNKLCFLLNLVALLHYIFSIINFSSYDFCYTWFQCLIESLMMRVSNFLHSFSLFFPSSIRLAMKKGSMYIMHMAKITQPLFVDVAGGLISMFCWKGEYGRG